MELRFWNDPQTGLPHIYTHGVYEDEVAEVLHRPGEDFAGDDESRIRLGQTTAGRYLQVIFVPDPGRKSACIGTAFDMSNKAKRAYRRRQRSRRR